MMRQLLICIAALLLPTQLLAQDGIGTRLDWGTVEVLIFPDPYTGMHLLASTTATSRDSKHHGISGGFEPESVFAWINNANRVLAPIDPPSGPDVVLLTPVLRSYAGDSLRLLRRPKGTGWDAKLVVLVDRPGPDSEHFDVLATEDNIRTLLVGLQQQAGLSGFDADSARVATDSVKLDVLEADAPTLIHPGTMRYPDRRLEGRVTMVFVIDTSGRVDMNTARPIFADHAVMAEWAKALIAGSRFRPGRIHGQPVRVRVQQSINYSP